MRLRQPGQRKIRAPEFEQRRVPGARRACARRRQRQRTGAIELAQARLKIMHRAIRLSVVRHLQNRRERGRTTDRWSSPRSQ
jgi:hypothetical protein